MAGWRLYWPKMPRQTFHFLTIKLRSKLSKLNTEQASAQNEPLVPWSSMKKPSMVSNGSAKTLPSYDKALATRNTCIGGLCLSWLIAIACIILARWTFKSGQIFRTQTGGYTHNGQGERVFFLSTARQEIVKLAVNVCISFCTDCLGYIHSTSTRWALWREGLLTYNSNPRLLVSTRRCSSSRWSSNLVSAFLLMVCYASSGQLFLSSTSAEEKGFVLNGIAISALGVGLLGQAMISTLCIWGSAELIPTWSSNCLNTAVTCLHLGMRNADSRCMMSVHQINQPSMPTKPLCHQASAQRTIPSIRHITRFLWVSVGVTIVWEIAIRSNPYFRKTSSTTLPLYGASVPVLELNVCALLITTSLQLFLTLSFHLTELLVNLSRDEHIWRLASSRKGTQSCLGPLGSLKSAVCSWQTILIFTLKSLTYWLFGLAVNSDGQSVYMNWEGVLLLFVGIFVVAVFGSILAWTQPSGSQPAAFGHLQTLVDLIDEWPQKEEAMWWGDKGLAKNPTIDGHEMIRRAGTANTRLKGIHIGAWYQ